MALKEHRRVDDRKDAIVAAIVSARARSKTLANHSQRKQFLQQYVENVPVEDLHGRSEELMARAAIDHLDFGAKRRKGQALLRIFNPTEAEHGYSSKYTFVEMVNDDMPFLVDSVAAAINRHDLVVHITVHPIISVKRDGKGKLTAIAKPGSKGAQSESFIRFAIQRETDIAELKLLRLEISKECPEDLCNFLLDHFSLEHADLFSVDGPVNLNRLATVCGDGRREDLCYAPFSPGMPSELVTDQNIFEILKKKNVLLHHPYHSFRPVIDFVGTAASDPGVLAIKQTLYRTGADSPIVDHLVRAAKSGKEISVVIELMARFEEAANIALANRLQEAGAHVVYGLVGYKTHAKMTLVVRREQGKLRRYVHLGTGNYHPGTTRLYTDYGYMSSNRNLGEDVHKVFMQLTSLTEAKDLVKIFTAPFNLFEALTMRIDREIEFCRVGKRAHIIAKINSLTEPKIINALYKASSEGVKIELIVRGICSLRPGVPGLSENITVRSIIGRFLEHSRVYYFRNDGDEEYYCSSADWMDRNFFRRTETCFPIRQKPLKKKLMQDLRLFLADNCQAWELQGDGHYVRLGPGNEKPLSAQQALLKKMASLA